MSRNTVFAVVAFAVLLVGVLIVQSQAPERGITRVSFKDVDQDAITKLEITGPNAATLQKEGDAWVINGKAADQAGVERVLGNITSIESSDLITQSEDRYSEFEVDDEKGARVKAYTGSSVVADFVVGKAATGGSHVRVDDDVFAVKGVYKNTFSKEPSLWYERRLLSGITPVDAEKLTATFADGHTYTLVKKDNEWAFEDPSVVPEGFRFDKNQARSLISSVVNVRAKDILDSVPEGETTNLEEGFDSFTLTAKKDDTESTYTITLGAAREDKSVFAKASTRTDVVTLPEYTAKNLRKRATDLRDMTMVEVDTNKVNKFEVQDGSTRLTFTKKDGNWQLTSSAEKKPKGFELDPGALSRKLSAFASARGKSVAEGVNKVQAGLAVPKATVTATLEDGSKVTLAFGRTFKEGETEVLYAQGNADDAIYVVTPYVRNNLGAGVASYQKQEAPAGGPAAGNDFLKNLDPKALANLPPEVRDSLLKQIAQKQQQEAMMKQIQAQSQQKAE